MKKLYSLIKACMTTDMNIFKISSKKKNKISNLVIIVLISLFFMITLYFNANTIFEKMAPLNLQYLVLSLMIFSTSIMTIIEGIYKAGPLIFNCKDDDLLLSLPIEKKTILFVRIFKFYVFELIFNSLFLIPFILSYITYANKIDYTFFLTNFIMLFILPIIPIVISCIIGAIVSGFSSRFKHKNIMQVVISMLFVIVCMYLGFNLDKILSYVAKHATSINDIIIKIYYPAGVYANLITDFNLIDLLIFILINIIIFIIAIFILSKFYFKISSRLKKVTTTKYVSIDKIFIKSNSIKKSLIKKEIKTFFSIPTLIINAGLGLVFFVLLAVIIFIKFDSVLSLLTVKNGFINDLITNSKSLIILILLIFTSFMTSITNSVISLEGRNINTLKSLPIDTKTILLSKIYSSLLITTPLILIGDILLFIKFQTNIFHIIMLLILSILLPLVSHFIGIIVNLRYPKLDAESDTEVVKQSISSFVSVMIGLILMILNIFIIISCANSIDSTLLLIFYGVFYLILNIILYYILIKKGIKQFNKLSI